MSCNADCDAVGAYYVGDIGTAVIVDTCSDLSTATLVALDITKPDGTTARWTGAVYDTTKIRYNIIAGDFDQDGEYRLQSYVEMPSWSGHGDTVTFKVRSLYQ